MAEQVQTATGGDGIELNETNDHERPKQDDKKLQDGNITSSSTDPGHQLADQRLKDYGQNIEGNIENDLVSDFKKHQKEEWWRVPGHQMDPFTSDDKGELPSEKDHHTPPHSVKVGGLVGSPESPIYPDTPPTIVRSTAMPSDSPYY